MTPRTLRLTRCLPVVLGLLAAVPASAAAHGPSGAPAGDKARGIDLAGLHETDPRCRGLFAVGATGQCTHGPDPAPPGVDVRQRRSTLELVGTTPPSFGATVAGTAVPPTDGSGAVVCEGDGVAGMRVQVLYVVASGQPDRFEAVKATLGQHAVAVDAQYNASAQQNGAARHLRFVTAADGAGGCSLDLRKVVVASTADDTFDATITAVKAQGHNRSDRKYMMFVDANVYCGIGTIYGDSQPGQANANNGRYAQYGRSDNGCWDYAEAHELMHNLGGVQPDAPNATPNFHCSDESDDMCYDDDGAGPVAMRQVCPTGVEGLFDCNDDDYFNAGTVPSGSYLATHWNTASSAFLIAPSSVAPDATAPAAPTGLTATGGPGSVALSWAASPEADLAGYRLLRDGVQIASLGRVTSYTDASLPAGTTATYVLRAVDGAGNVSGDSAPATATAQVTVTTETLTGSFSKSAQSRAFTRTAVAGASRIVASGSTTSKGRSAPATVSVRLRGPGVDATYTGPAIDVSPTLPASGAYTWTVSGAAGVRYSMALTYGR